MKLSYRLDRVCGNIYNNGNVVFTPDGNCVLSPIGNRLNIFDLIQQTSTILPFENRKDIKRCAMSHNGRFLITVDVDGHALFINFPRRVVLQRFNFKRKVYDIKISPNDEMFAVTFAHGCQIWRMPHARREFSPLTLMRTIGGHHDNTICLDWSTDSESIIMGSRDLTAKIFYRVTSKYMAMSTLSGHRDKIIGVFFSQDGNTAYTIARDGAVFTWTFESVPTSFEEIKPNAEKSKRKRGGKTSSHRGADIDDDDEDNEEDGDSEEREEARNTHPRSGRWGLKGREFLWEPHTEVTSVAFNKLNNLLVVGFNKGVFGLYEVPGCVNIHRLSVSHHSLNTACINSSGEWLALGSARLGQLLVWEWQSETYVLKQQGHLYGLNSVDFSADGQFIATGGDDNKVKLWSTSSGFCVVTFADHIAPVTGVRFIGKGVGKSIISSSLDGTVRAHDLLRYRNFRTLTSPTPVQFTTVAADPSGEIVCSGAMDPFSIYVWSLQTGHILDVLAGHEGPIACLEFAASGPALLASGSWDGTLKVWDVYKSECVETMAHGCDVLGLAFRPDGKEICTCTTNGNLNVWDVESGSSIVTIEGRRDISGGRLSTDRVTAQNSSRSKHFTSVTYTADGTCVLAGGHSKFTCIYAVGSGTLVKKFQLSHNRSLEGILDELNSAKQVDGVSVENIRVTADSDDSDNERKAVSVLPGKGRVGNGSGDGSRTTRPEILTTAVRFSPTGREWAASTTQGLQIFSLDDAMVFAPNDLDIAITPQAVHAAIFQRQFGLALSMALQLSLSEASVLKAAVDAVPLDALDLVVQSLSLIAVKDLLRFLAQELAQSRHLEVYLRWCWELLRFFGPALQRDATRSLTHRQNLKALIRSIGIHEREALKISDENHFTLTFLCSQIEYQISTKKKREAHQEELDASEGADMGTREAELSQTQSDEDDGSVPPAAATTATLDGTTDVPGDENEKEDEGDQESATSPVQYSGVGGGVGGVRRERGSALKKSKPAGSNKKRRSLREKL